MTAAVVVLNATYQPISHTRVSRAINLVRRGDAVIEESDPHKQVRSKGGQYPYPLIIRMLRFIKVPFNYGPKIWTKNGVIERDEGKCAYCGKPGATTVDHVLPRAQGGRDAWDNTVACCSPCNAKKRDRTPAQARMPLLFKPYTPMRIQFGR